MVSSNNVLDPLPVLSHFCRFLLCFVRFSMENGVTSSPEASRPTEARGQQSFFASLQFFTFVAAFPIMFKSRIDFASQWKK